MYTKYQPTSMQPYGRDQKGAFMDRRIQRTRNSLFSAFIELRAVKPVEKITVKEMGQKLHLDSGTLTPVLKKLLSMELIDKYRDKDDDRVVIVEVTEKGRKMKEEIIEVPEKMYCKFGKNIEDVVELKRLLDNLLATFK